MSYDPNASRIGHTFNLECLLRQRGLSFSSQQGIERTLFPIFREKTKATEEDFFDLMSDNEFRKDMRRTIFGNSKSITVRDMEFKFSKDDELMFTKSFEWYVAQLLTRKFNFFTVGYGINLDSAPEGMDFDVLGFGLDLFVHAECKTGNPDGLGKGDVANFKKKCDFLGADVNIFYVDYNGLNAKKHALLGYFPEVFYKQSGELYSITKPGTGFQIHQVDIAPVFIIDTHKSNKDVVQNFREIFYLYFRMRSHERTSHGYAPDIFREHGYVVEKI